MKGFGLESRVLVNVKGFEGLEIIRLQKNEKWDWIPRQEGKRIGSNSAVDLIGNLSRYRKNLLIQKGGKIKKNRKTFSRLSTIKNLCVKF